MRERRAAATRGRQRPRCHGSQREIRRRIGSVRNIKQITRAMQFVAASKLKRAQDATLAARPYSEKLDEVLADLAAVLGGEDHPLLAEREGGTRLIVLITTDRGLAGPLNTNIIRFAAREIIDNPGDLAVVTVGRKGRDAMRRAGVPLEAALRRLRRPARRSPTSCRSPASSPTTTSPARTAGSTSSTAASSRRSSSGRTLRPLLPIEPTEDTEGIPGNQFIFEPSAARRARAAPAALRRDAPLPGRPRGARPARSRAGWSR